MKRQGEFHLYIHTDKRKQWQDFLEFCENSGKSASRFAVEIVLANWQNPNKRMTKDKMTESRASLMNKYPEDF